MDQQEEADILDPTRTMWETMCNWIPAAEQPEVRRYVGEALLSELEDLHQELCLLTDIWRDYRATTSDEENAMDVDESNQQRLLPEPPNARQRLEQEIRFFAQCLKHSNSSALSNDVVRHVCEQPSDAQSLHSEARSQSATSRPKTAKSVTGEELPIRSRSAEHGRLDKSRGSQRPVQMEELGLANIEQEAERLREIVTEEIENMKLDIEFLRECIEGEHEYRVQLLAERGRKKQVISLTDLREVRAALEKEYLEKAQYPSASTVLTGAIPSHVKHDLPAVQVKAKRDLPALQRTESISSRQGQRTLPRPATSHAPAAHFMKQEQTQQGQHQRQESLQAPFVSKVLPSIESRTTDYKTNTSGNTITTRAKPTPSPASNSTSVVPHPPPARAPIPHPPPPKRPTSGTPTSPTPQRPRLGSGQVTVSASLRARRLLKASSTAGAPGGRQLPSVPPPA
eukprot:m.148612 g.148612  ORF g.148612 m.148612 type:complete len:455 (-) comp16137_c0_seq2:692-2056(-)